jgi:hypothetical protein
MKALLLFACVALLAACSTPGANPDKYAGHTKWAAPEPHRDIVTLETTYPNKDALLEDIKAKKFEHLVTLDGKVISVGFHPALQFRTNSDNSVSR